ncbi:MAG: YihY/virulence factor BrkB family protein [Cytophagales bacterium]|nr:YihY/virulence factor BrkB family protein [Cytophagales bacterium]
MTLKARITQVRKFFAFDIWRIQIEKQPTYWRWLLKFFRVLIITFSEFRKDRVHEKASNLTYFTLLSIVPVIAMAFGISKGFGLESLLEKELGNFFKGQEEVLTYVMGFASKMIDSTNGGIVTGIGSVILLYTVMRLLNTIELTFNVIWDTKKSRPIHRKLTDYMSVMVLGVLLIILSSSATVFIASEIKKLELDIGLFSNLKSGALFLINLVPYAFIWLLLFLVYIVFPNTRVKVIPALIAGILAGTAYQLTQYGFINFQFAFARYNAIYGSLALFPLFMIYLQLSWFIVLFGAELAYAMQNASVWEPDDKKLKMSLSHKKKVMLLIMHRIIKRFVDQAEPVSVKQLVQMGNVPHRFIREICDELEKSGLTNRLEGDKGEDLFQPAFDVQQMDISTVLNKYELEGLGHFDNTKSATFLAIENSISEMEELIGTSKSNVLLKDLG